MAQGAGVDNSRSICCANAILPLHLAQPLVRWRKTMCASHLQPRMMKSCEECERFVPSQMATNFHFLGSRPAHLNLKLSQHRLVGETGVTFCPDLNGAASPLQGAVQCAPVVPTLSAISMGVCPSPAGTRSVSP